MTVRAGQVEDPTCAQCHAAHEAEKIALRLRIARLEAELERKTGALHRVMAFFEDDS